MIIENETRQAQVQLIIVQGKINSLPLLGRTILEELGIVKIDESGRFKEPNKPGITHNIRKIEEKQITINELLEPIKTTFMELAKQPETEKKYNYIYQ